jgi:hypothetical protein
VYLREASRNCR